MNQTLLCMGCMARKGNAAVCQQCGYFDRPAENPQQLPPRTILENKYIIGRVLGQGGFGITYLGCDLELNKKLAIKEYFPVQISTRAQDHLTVSPISTKSRRELDYGLSRFADEARALTQFRSNPGVVSILDFLYAHGTAYIVMEYVDGRDLKEYLHQHGGKISYEAGLKILLLIMAALEEVHRAGIVHRDISPDNIYVQANGAVKILDFGATRYAMGEQSRSLSIVLKPGYAPEEQYRGKGRQGPWTDIYALGATFYRTITGFVPPDALDRLIDDELAPPSARGVPIPGYAETALMKSLALKAENRFQTIAAFREAMTPHKVTPQTPAKQTPAKQAPAQIEEMQPVGEEVAENGSSLAPVVLRPAHLPKGLLLASFSILLLIFFIATEMRRTIWGEQLLAPVILFGLMMYVFVEMWKPIQDGHARTTPENAVAFSFIPGFNLYWAFSVMWGFAKDYNAFLDRHSLGGKRLNESLFLLASIAYVAACICAPFAGVFAAAFILLAGCLLLPVVCMICDAVNQLTAQAETGATADEPIFSLCCISGEREGETFNVTAEGLVIGRNPSQANVVLTSGDVSGQHARVWQDAANAGVWMEDLKSTNGTYFRRKDRKEGTGSTAEWTRVVHRQLLFHGDQVRLSAEGDEFEVHSE